MKERETERDRKREIERERKSKGVGELCKGVLDKKEQKNEESKQRLKTTENTQMKMRLG